MRIKQVLVFKTSFYSPLYREFSDSQQLKQFLSGFDFMKPHPVSNLRTGLPEFELTTRVVIQQNGEPYTSVPQHATRFIAARKIRVDKSKPGQVRIFAEIPMDVPSNNDSNVVNREYREVLLPKKSYDAIIDLQHLRQLWPMCKEKSRGELQKFLTSAMHTKNAIKGR